MSKNIEPDVAAHLHSDLHVTPGRVRAFGSDTYSVQLAVLTQLRRAALEDSGNLEFSVFGLALTLLGIFIAPGRVLPVAGVPWYVSLAVGAVVGAFGVVLLIPFLIGPLLRQGRRERAIIWLAAYEDELSRWRNVGGAAGRRWRAEH